MAVPPIEPLLLQALRASLEAGKAILRVYGSDFGAGLKADQTPITLADRHSHQIVAEALSKAGFPLLSEEGRDIPCAERKAWETFWLVDPLDGTKEFISRNGEFTVNVALVQDGVPVLGVVLAPALQRLFEAASPTGAVVEDADGRRHVSARAQPAEGATVVSSRSHG